MTLLSASGQSKRYALFQVDVLIMEGELSGAEYMATPLTVVADEDDNTFLGAVAGYADAFPPLPEPGQSVEADRIYNYDGTLVLIRQAHTRRAEDDPLNTLALYAIYREDAGEALDWIAGESVVVGTRRLYNDVLYQCLQAHTTQSDYTPLATLGVLWQVVAPPTAEWAVGVAYKVGDEVMYQGALYRCRQAHTSIATWTPPAVLALWLPI